MPDPHSPNPSACRPASARSTPDSRARVTGVPYGSRDARQAAAGLSHAQARAGASRPHVGLGEAGVDQREGRAPLGGGPLARPVVAQVVEVHAQDHRRPRAAASGPAARSRASLHQ